MSARTSAESFGIGDIVAATSDFCIGGNPVVEKGCKGKVICHGERPDGGIGVCILFDERKDGRDANVLCRPHEIDVVTKAADVQHSGDHSLWLPNLQYAWEGLRGIITSLRYILPGQAGTEDDDETSGDNLAVVRSSSSSQKHKPKHKRKGNDRGQQLQDTVGQDDLEETSEDESQQQQQRWSMLIVGLTVANAFLGHLHMQRRAGKHNPLVKTLTDASFSDHITAYGNGTLVNFFSSPCAPCKRLAPQFEEAAKQLRLNANVSLVSVNAALAPQAFKKYLVSRVPALLWFRRGKLVQVLAQSVQTSSQITEFVHMSLQPAVIEFGSYEEYLDAVPQLRTVLAKGKTPPIVAGFGSNPAVYDVLEQVGEKFRGETAFLFVPEARKDDPTIRAFFRNATSDLDYTGALTEEEFLSWLQPFMIE